MKQLVFISLFACAILLFLESGCKKKFNLPELSTTQVTGITRTTADCGGVITSDGGAEIFDRGVCWSIIPDPTIADKVTSSGSGTGTFTAVATGLSFNTTYYIRAYATNSAGTAYGNTVVFTTTDSDFAIGELYGGGIIFYIDNTGEHGLVTAEKNQDKVFWSNESMVTGATATAVGTGQANTTTIVNVLAPFGIHSAAKVCDDLDLNGFTDWFLPSKDELNLMFANLVPLELGNFGWDSFWSSSETSLSNAWEQNFRLGEQHDWNKNINTYHVRAVRAF